VGKPRAGRTPLEEGGDPRARWTPLEGGASPRARRTSFEGGLSPRARRTSLEEALWWAALVGRGDHHSVDRFVCIFCVWPEIGFAFCVFCRFLAGFPRFFRGPSWLSPTVAPEHLRVYRSGSRRCWSLLMGRSSLPVANTFPQGRVSGPAGLAPEALQECECSCRGFSYGILSAGVVHVSTGIGGVSAGFGDARAAGIFPFGASQEV
jgi:hypothetical protein